jgi:hypothetical protein
MKRIFILIASMIALVLGFTPEAQAGHVPETTAGVIHAAQRDGHTCARAVNSSLSISHGVAALAVHDLVGNSCGNGGPGCEEIWAYTGTDWGLLGWCSQDLVVYPTTLPGQLVVCHGVSSTFMRSGPGFNYRVVGRVNADTTIGTDSVKLVTIARGGRDGVAWYRVRWHGRTVWVASLRVTSRDNGCRNWAEYWSHMHHR